MRYATRRSDVRADKNAGEKEVPVEMFVVLSRDELALISRDMLHGEIRPEDMDDAVIVEWMMDTVDVSFGDRGVE